MRTSSRRVTGKKQDSTRKTVNCKISELKSGFELLTFQFTKLKLIHLETMFGLNHENSVLLKE